MKKFYAFCFLALAAFTAKSQVAVTFSVDMSAQVVSPNGVHIAGNFYDVNYDGVVENAAYVNWDPAAISMTDQGGGIYSITLNLIPEHYEFKFINGDAWAGAENVPVACQYGVNSNSNRWFDVTGANTDESIFVCFESCAPCGENVVRFRVDMTQEVSGVNPVGVYVAGDFQGWDPAGSPLQDFDANGIWEGYFSIGTATSIQYKFINGNDWAFAESVPGDCNVGGNRTADIFETNTDLSTVCFSACGPCTAPTPVFFRCDMSLQPVNLSNPPHVAGSFQSWNPGDAAWAMEDPDGDNIWELTALLQPGTYQYKFVNGSSWSDNNESLPADCNVGGNREVVVGVDPVIEYWCYNQCGSACIVDPDPANITFRVNMMNTTVAAQGVWMIGGFTTPSWQAGAVQMTDDNTDGIYECTVLVSGSADIQFKYMNGDVNAPTNEEGPGIIPCGIDNGVGGHNRVHSRTGIDEVLNVVCFDSCADCIIGVQELGLLEALNAYPVPASEFVFLTFGQVKSAPLTVRVLNNLGQVVSTQYMGNLPAGNNQIRVNLEGVASGIYAIELSNGMERKSVQIAVK